MTITFGPVDATSGSPTYSAKQERQLRAPLLGNPTGRVLGGRSGWRVGTTASVVSVTSTTWTLNPCAAMIEPAAMLYQGAYPWATDAVVTGPVTAADGTNPRIDILYIQINDNSAGDGTGLLSAPVSYLAGAATATPAAPTLPPRSFLVATISVPKAGGGSPAVTFNAQYFVAAGGLLPVANQAERDSLTPYEGMIVVRNDLNGAQDTFNGGAWVTTMADITTFGTGFAATNTTSHKPRVRRVGNQVFLYGAVTCSPISGTSGGNLLTVPAAFQPPTGATRFIGTVVSQNGVVSDMVLQNGVVQQSGSYATGTITTNGVTTPLNCMWWLD